MTLMFQPQFSPMIQSGRKYHTVRPVRKVPLRIGQPLSLRVWSGKPYRSKQVEFATATVIRVSQFWLGPAAEMKIDGLLLNWESQNYFAWHDGFLDAIALRYWFTKTHGLPFVGQVIYWNLHETR